MADLDGGLVAPERCDAVGPGGRLGIGGSGDALLSRHLVRVRVRVRIRGRGRVRGRVRVRARVRVRVRGGGRVRGRV